MIWAVAALATVSVALLAALIWERHASSKMVATLLADRDRAEGAWTAERRELLNRIQKPDVLPYAPPVAWQMPTEAAELDESAAVGAIAYDDTYGEGDFSNPEFGGEELADG